MKVALVFLTWNRLDFVKRAVEHNYRSVGYPIEEIVWVDNGSEDGTVEWMEAFLADKNHKKHLFKKNQGIGAGYNKIYSLVGDVDLIARPSSDMCMPENWLKDMVGWHKRISQTGIVAMISESYKHILNKRFIGEQIEVNGFNIQPANALGSIVFKKKIIDEGIFLPEMGKYGYEDTLWTEKVRNVGYLNYYVDGIVQDFPQEEIQKYGDYVRWKVETIRKLEQENPQLLELNKNING